MKESAQPVDVRGLGSDVAQLLGGATSHTTCVVSASGRVKCWGFGSDFLAADWSPEDGPIEIAGLDIPIDTLAIGMLDICALTRAGRVQCWGRNDSGQLGTGSYESSKRPQFVAGF
jgi:alpha-tubulin suppressor-like RCC1 family protein